MLNVDFQKDERNDHTGRKHRMPDLRKLATQKVSQKLPKSDPKATHRSIKGPNLDTRSIAVLTAAR